MSDDQTVSELECKAIRGLSDFDMTMFVSEIHDHGWLHARATLRMMPSAQDLFDDLREVQAHAAESERPLIHPKSMPAWPMVQAILSEGCTPLLLIGGKPMGPGFCNYQLAGHNCLSVEDILQILKRLVYHMDGTAQSEAESN